MSASLEEIAARAGVSIATASRAINGKEGVKSETRERVLAIAQELQYSASMAGRGLATSRTDIICYVVNRLHDPLDEDPFYPIIMRGLEAELSRQGYHLLLTTASDEQLKSASTFKPVMERRVDGVILAGPDIAPRFIIELKQMGIPVLLIDNNLTAITIDAINNDDVQGARIATEHLIEHEHRSIVALLGPQSWHSSAQRGHGYQQAMQAAHRSPRIFSTTGTTFETGKELMSQALAAVPDLTAVFTANDAMAFGAIRALQEQGKRVPEDVAIIGFDDTFYCSLSQPPLSTVRVFKRELGRLAARRMLDMLAAEVEQNESYPVQTQLAGKLIKRHSCGCLTTGDEPA